MSTVVCLTPNAMNIYSPSKLTLTLALTLEYKHTLIHTRVMNTTLAFFHHLNNIFHAIFFYTRFLSFIRSFIRWFSQLLLLCHIRFVVCLFVYQTICVLIVCLPIHIYLHIYTNTQLCGSDIRGICAHTITIHYLQHAHPIFVGGSFYVYEYTFFFFICSLIRLLNEFTEWICFKH